MAIAGAWSASNNCWRWNGRPRRMLQRQQLRQKPAVRANGSARCPEEPLTRLLPRLRDRHLLAKRCEKSLEKRNSLTQRRRVASSQSKTKEFLLSALRGLAPLREGF